MDEGRRHFTIRCGFCGWRQETTGFSRDLAHLKEMASSCSKCGKPRRFSCPKCRRPATMTRNP